MAYTQTNDNNNDNNMIILWS